MPFIKERRECLGFFCFLLSSTENNLRQRRGCHIYQFQLISSEVRCTEENESTSICSFVMRLSVRGVGKILNVEQITNNENLCVNVELN
jgi:hypothetical protein